VGRILELGRQGGVGSRNMGTLPLGDTSAGKTK